MTSGPSDVQYVNTTPNVNSTETDINTIYTPASAYFDSTTPYSNKSFNDDKTADYISSLLNSNSSVQEIKIEKKYLDLFSEPGNCLTLPNGTKLCIINDDQQNQNTPTTNSPEGFNNYRENFIENLDGSVPVKISVQLFPSNPDNTNTANYAQTTLAVNENSPNVTSTPLFGEASLDCDNYVSNLIENVKGSEAEYIIDKKYVTLINQCFKEPGNCITLSNGKIVCISEEITPILLPNENNPSVYRVKFQITGNDIPINDNENKNVTIYNTTNPSSVQTNLSDSDFARLSEQIEKKMLNDIVSGANSGVADRGAPFTPSTTNPSVVQNNILSNLDSVNQELSLAQQQYREEQQKRTTFAPQSTYSAATTTLPQSTYSAQDQGSINYCTIDQVKLVRNGSQNNWSSDDANKNPGRQQILRNNNNNIFQSGGMSVQPETRDNGKTNGQLPSVSSNDAKIIFPDAPNAPDNYSYYGALRSKGSEYVPMNSISETNKMLGRLDYAPPPLPPNMDFSYFGALRNKGGEDVKPVNALQGPNNYSEKILDENLYSISGKIGMQEFPIPNRIDYTMSRPEVNKNNPINNGSQPVDLYSQYGALVPKDNFYAK
jgi:hypothetical protein